MYWRKHIKLIFSQVKEAFIDEVPKKETDFKKVLQDKDVIAIGPGIGFSKTSENLVKWVIHSSEAPVILDADALTIVSKHPEWLKKAKSSLILTPHPGEMASLMKKTSREIQENRLELPSFFAKKYGVFIALKGANTVVASPKGEVTVNSTGNPAMATAGMGDVLCGMIASFIGQGMEPYDAVCSAVFLHGQLADDWVSAHHASRGLIASDIIEMIPSGVERLFFNL
jgi:NAD(P)H-hydrate epimerase